MKAGHACSFPKLASTFTILPAFGKKTLREKEKTTKKASSINEKWEYHCCFFPDCFKRKYSIIGSHISCDETMTKTI